MIILSLDKLVLQIPKRGTHFAVHLVHETISELTLPPFFVILILLLTEIPGLIISALIVDKLGRKLSMSSMLFTSFLFMGPLVFYQSEVLTAISLFGARVCISASFTIVYIYAPEVSFISSLIVILNGWISIYSGIILNG